VSVAGDAVVTAPITGFYALFERSIANGLLILFRDTFLFELGAGPVRLKAGKPRMAGTRKSCAQIADLQQTDGASND
jgi:hypothetical protein